MIKNNRMVPQALALSMLGRGAGRYPFAHAYVMRTVNREHPLSE